MLPEIQSKGNYRHTEIGITLYTSLQCAARFDERSSCFRSLEPFIGWMQTLPRSAHRQNLRKEFPARGLWGTESKKMATTYKSAETIPESGIYRVIHAQHRLPHEVTLIAGQTFPPCAKCRDEVRFELARELPSLARERRGSVSLYTLPVLEEEELEEQKSKDTTA